MEPDERYCSNCKEYTDHLCRYSTHERDSSADFLVCQVCKWEYRGFTGKYEPPSETDWSEDIVDKSEKLKVIESYSELVTKLQSEFNLSLHSSRAIIALVLEWVDE